MEYDTATGAYWGFPEVLQSGFPLVLSMHPTSHQPLVAPYPGTTQPCDLNLPHPYIGISAAPATGGWTGRPSPASSSHPAPAPRQNPGTPQAAE